MSNFFQAPFRTEKKFFFFALIASLTSEDFQIFFCSYLRRVSMGVTDWMAVGIALGTFLFYLLYGRFTSRKKPRRADLRRAYLWWLRQSQLLQSRVFWYKLKFYFSYIVVRCNMLSAYLPQWKSRSTVSDETLEKKMLLRHYRNILNRHK